jgi:hypothetical protein
MPTVDDASPDEPGATEPASAGAAPPHAGVSAAPAGPMSGEAPAVPEATGPLPAESAATEPVPADQGRRRRRAGLLAAPLIILAAVLSSGPLPAISRSLEEAADSVRDAVSGPGGPFATDGAPTISGDPPPSGSTGPDLTPAPSGPTPSISARPAPSSGEGDYLLMSRADLMALPTSGPAWEALRGVADIDPGGANLRDQDDRHGVMTLAIALVHARTGEPGYRERAREEIMEVIGTERRRTGNSILSLGRQLPAYVLAADFIELDGADDERFREWLDGIRTEELGGHGRWRELVATHEDSANNWGAFAGAARIAASRYLDDTEDVEQAARVLAGFLGDRTAWAGFQPVDESASWACEPEQYTPVNPPCVRDGIDVDGAIVRDIDRGGDLRWPPGDTGIDYTLESLQGLILQAELLYQGGYGDPWSWSDSAIRRAARIVTASGQAGGESWNPSEPSLHVPWLLNARYDLGLPTEPAGIGRAFGFTDWLYGD